MRIELALFASVSCAVLLMGHDAAADEPSNQQIRVVSYSPLRRTDIIGIVGQPTTITFPRAESIYRVVQSGKPDKDGAIADAGWQGASPTDVKDSPLGNNLTLWPVAQGQSTMTVITLSGEGVQKVYPFRLVAVPDDAAALGFDVTLNLIFQGTGPDHAAGPAPAGIVKGATQAVVKRRQSTADMLVAAKERLRTDAFNGTEGCHYTAKGKRPNAIEPRCPLDNGEWTLMRFPGLSKKPAVYVGSCEVSKDDERLARQHADGDFVVVEEIAARFCLRLGPDVLDIINDAYDPAGKPTGGTISPTVVRDLIQAKAR